VIKDKSQLIKGPSTELFIQVLTFIDLIM